MQEFMRPKYFSVTKILSPNLTSVCPCHIILISIAFGRQQMKEGPAYSEKTSVKSMLPLFLGLFF